MESVDSREDQGVRGEGHGICPGTVEVMRVTKKAYVPQKVARAFPSST